MGLSRLIISCRRFSMALLLFGLLFSGIRVKAQSAEIEQLLLNVEKLAQFKNILKDMKTGYQIISSGYTAVRDISKGNFSLHSGFLDGLLAVSPEVRKYHKIAEIVSMQGKIISEYKSALARFNADGGFSLSELDYMAKVYGQLNKQSLQNLDALLMVITAGELRMSDEERLSAIDRIFSDMQEKLVFLRYFNGQALGISRQRQMEASELSTVRELYKLNP